MARPLRSDGARTPEAGVSTAGCARHVLGRSPGTQRYRVCTGAPPGVRRGPGRAADGLDISASMRVNGPQGAAAASPTAERVVLGGRNQLGDDEFPKHPRPTEPDMRTRTALAASLVLVAGVGSL